VGHIHNNGGLKNNNDNITPIFIGLNKTTQKHGCHKGRVTQRKINSYVPKQMYINVNDENVMTLECFNMGTNACGSFDK
jgi:hypothetical protein